MNKINFICLICAAFVMTGCLSNPTKNWVDPELYYLSAKSGYVYGKFHLSLQETSPSVQYALEVENRNTEKKYRIYILQKDYLFAVALPDGVYRFTSIYFNGDKRKFGNNITPEQIPSTFHVEQGKALYIGDWECTYQSKTQSDAGTTYYYMFYYATVLDNYARTTQVFEALYGKRDAVQFDSIFHYFID